MSEPVPGFVVLGVLLMAGFAGLAYAVPEARLVWLVAFVTLGFEPFWLGLAPGGPLLRYGPMVAVPAVALPVLAVRERRAQNSDSSRRVR